ncbi:MAG: hypothetical protein WC549_10260 [Actinomycetota bacterium]
MSNFELFLGILGIVLSFFGFGIAIFQTVRNIELKRALNRIKKIRNAEVWTIIGICLTVFDSLEEARKFIYSRKKIDHEVLSKITSARRGTVDQYRYLLMEAVLDEPTYNIETIKKWKRIGKLENEWRVEQAKRLLSTENIPGFPGNSKYVTRKNRKDNKN